MRLRAILFDYGGTLDGAGNHWLDRFVRLYQEAGLALPFDTLRNAFDHATHCAYADPSVAELGLQALIEFHVARQLEHLGVADDIVAAQVSDAFVRGSRTGLEASRAVLSRLRHRAALGVISNFYGNLERILDEAGISPWLATIIDSNRVSLSKPDPAIFTLALRRVGCEPSEAMYVGDSFEKDMIGARRAGLRTAWLVGANERVCPMPELVDVQLRSLEDLEVIIT